MKQIVIFPRGQTSDKDRRMLARAGVLLVEADDPSKVVTVLPVVPLIAQDDILRVALQALANSDSATCTKFVRVLASLVEKPK